MTSSQLRDICFDCSDQYRLAQFWADVLGYEMRAGDPGADPDQPVALEPSVSGMRIWFSKVPEPKIAKNRVHIDINLPDDAELQRLESLGAQALQEIRDEEGRLCWTVMADPEGNEFCAFPPAS